MREVGGDHEQSLFVEERLEKPGQRPHIFRFQIAHQDGDDPGFGQSHLEERQLAFQGVLPDVRVGRVQEQGVGLQPPAGFQIEIYRTQRRVVGGDGRDGRSPKGAVVGRGQQHHALPLAAAQVHVAGGGGGAGIHVAGVGHHQRHRRLIRFAHRVAGRPVEQGLHLCPEAVG